MEVRKEISEEELAREAVQKYKTIAVVGLSKDPTKDSYTVSEYLQQHGFKVIPVNPTATELLGEKVYPSLLDIPDEIARTIEIIDIFRPSEAVPPIVEQAITLKNKYRTNPKMIWMQLGIRHDGAAEAARKAGLEVIQDMCMRVEHRRASRAH
ncbi:MAG: CoA-binding protein [Thaumarchaeota archaeon]|nr:CoA-binding protein [Nitrososphaerota archaeon]